MLEVAVTTVGSSGIQAPCQRKQTTELARGYEQTGPISPTASGELDPAVRFRSGSTGRPAVIAAGWQRVVVMRHRA